MTPVELAALRDKVARKRAKQNGNLQPGGNKRGWSRDRLDAGDAALSALRKATKRRPEPHASPGTPAVPKTRTPRCVYCGWPCRRGRGNTPSTCVAHSDLPKLDPFYADQEIAA